MTKKKAAYTISFETLTPKLFESLFRSVGWESPCIEQIETALKIIHMQNLLHMTVTNLSEWLELSAMAVCHSI